MMSRQEMEKQAKDYYCGLPRWRKLSVREQSVLKAFVTNGRKPATDYGRLDMHIHTIPSAPGANNEVTAISIDLTAAGDSGLMCLVDENRKQKIPVGKR
jgi:hypothetical protein